MPMNRKLRAARRAVRHIVRRRMEAVADALKAAVSPPRGHDAARTSLTSDAKACVASIAQCHEGP